MRRRVFFATAVAAACGLGLIAAGRSLPGASGRTAAPLSSSATTGEKAADPLLAFTRTPRRPGNLLERVGVVGRSAEGRPIGLRQLGDPSIAAKVLVVGCIHGDECAGRRIFPTSGGSPIRAPTSSSSRT
jgi:hypothetical protein